jgi:hypothetical protein
MADPRDGSQGLEPTNSGGRMAMWLGDSDERFKSSLHHCTILYNYKSFWLILYHIFNAIEHVYIIILSIPYLHGIPSYYFHWHPISSLPPCPGSEWIMHAKSGYTAYRVPVAQAASYYDVQIQVRLDQPGGPWWTMVDHGGPWWTMVDHMESHPCDVSKGMKSP